MNFVYKPLFVYKYLFTQISLMKNHFSFNYFCKFKAKIINKAIYKEKL